MGKSSAPPPPDPAATAAAQTASNQQTAAYNTAINRVDQYSPQGSSTWTMRPGADPNNPQAGDYIQTTSLSPGQQSLYDAQGQISNNLAQTGLAGLDRVSSAMATPFSTDGLMALSGTNQQAGAGLQSGVNTSGMTPVLGSGQSYADQVKAVQDATYAKMQPGLDQSREQKENALLNSGIEKGTQAWDDAQRTLSTAENDARTSSILAGSAEQSRLAGLDQSARGQQFAEGQTNLQDNNSVQQTTQQQAIANALFNNQSRQQGITEGTALRQIPLNELNALRTGSQVASPSFSGYYTGAQSGGTDVAGIQNNAYNASVANTNAANAQAGQTAGAVGTAAAMALSYY